MDRMPPDLQYNQTIEMRFQLSDQTIPVFTKQGIPDWDRLSPSATILADYLDLSGVKKMLLYGCGHGAMVVYLAQKMKQGLLLATDSFFLSHQLTEKTIKANG